MMQRQVILPVKKTEIFIILKSDIMYQFKYHLKSLPNILMNISMVFVYLAMFLDILMKLIHP